MFPHQFQLFWSIDFWEDFWKYHTCILNLPFKMVLTFIQTNLNPFTYECFVPMLVEIGRLVLEKKIKLRKVYDDNDNYRPRLSFDQKSSPEPSVHNHNWSSFLLVSQDSCRIYLFIFKKLCIVKSSIKIS